MAQHGQADMVTALRRVRSYYQILNLTQCGGQAHHDPRSPHPLTFVFPPARTLAPMTIIEAVPGRYVLVVPTDASFPIHSPSPPTPVHR
jgi:hypothetical protein